ncbi:3-oxoacyl-ACP reductase OS=Streptomyces microflavus OX=1919 GN=G3I39_29475 PE=3 SV=1 [Streptomyces microflavus]
MSLPLPLDGLSAIVTGAGRGLGRAEALELARLGAAVVVNDYGQPGRDGSGEASAAPAEEVAAEIRAAGGRATAHLGDVSDHEQARALVELAVSTYGKLDILVNNAGILRDRMVFSMSEDEWDAVIRVHLKGHFNTTRFAAAHWRARSKETGGPVYGRIVNTSSEAFLAGSAGQPNYAAAKGGLVGYLASPAAAGVNGQLLVVHGGMVAIVERPRVAAKFDAAKETFTFAELDELITPYYADRPRGETFAAAEVLGLKRE